jgi:hypothetical protein
LVRCCPRCGERHRVGAEPILAVAEWEIEGVISVHNGGPSKPRRVPAPQKLEHRNEEAAKYQSRSAPRGEAVASCDCSRKSGGAPKTGEYERIDPYDARLIDAKLYSTDRTDDSTGLTKPADTISSDGAEKCAHLDLKRRTAFGALRVFGKHLTVSLSGRQPPSGRRREHTIVLCARGACPLTSYGRSKHG